MVPHRAAQQLMHRQLQRLALDVPQRQIHRPQRVNLLASRRVEPGNIHLLPDGLNLERILPNQRPGALRQRVRRTAFANAGDPRVGLHRHHHVALVEQRIVVRRLVHPHPRDLHLWQGGFGELAARESGGSERLEELTAFHAPYRYIRFQCVIE